VNPRRPAVRDEVLFTLVLIDAVLLATLELLFLPLRVRDLTDVGPDWLTDQSVPISILVALVTGPLLVIAAAGVTRRPMTASAPLLVWLLAMLAVGAFGPGGDVLLLNDWRSVVLLAAGTLPGAMVLGRILGRAIRDQLGSGDPRVSHRSRRPV
jgi:hypothetical protein